MSEGRAPFRSLLNQLENVYNLDISGERTKVTNLERRVKSLEEDNHTLKQQTDRLKCDLVKHTKLAVRATRRLRLETRKFHNQISQLISHLKFTDKTLQVWIEKIRALSLESQFGLFTDVEHKIAKILASVEKIEAEACGTGADTWSRKEHEDPSSGIVCDDNAERDAVGSPFQSKDRLMSLKQVNQSSCHEQVQGHRKRRIVKPASCTLLNGSKDQDISDVSDPVSSLFLDETSLPAVVSPIPQSDSQLSVDITSSPQLSPEIPGKYVQKRFEQKRSTSLRTRKQGRCKYTKPKEGENELNMDTSSLTVPSHRKVTVQENEVLYVDDDVIDNEPHNEELLVEPVIAEVPCDVETPMHQNTECPHDRTVVLNMGLRTPRSDMTMLLFSEDRNETTRHGDCMTDESTCWESPLEVDDDENDDGNLQELSMAILNGTLDHLREMSQECPLLSHLYSQMSGGDVGDNGDMLCDNTNGQVKAKEPETTTVDGEAKKKRLGDDLGFKYHEVVRRKDIRQQLDGHTCKCCEKFYQDQNLTPCSKRRLLKLVSRHKALHTPPRTPPGFWSLRMPDSEECVAKGYIRDDKQRMPLERKRACVLPKTAGEDMSRNVSELLKNRATRLY